MKCFYHPDIDASATCSNCGRAICSQCGEYVNGKMYCQDCANQLKADLQYYADENMKKEKRYITAISIELIITAILLLISLFILISQPSLINFLICWLIIGIPGAIENYIVGRPKTYEEQVLNKLDKLYYRESCLGSIFIAILYCCFGPITAIANLIYLINYKKSKK